MQASLLWCGLPSCEGSNQETQQTPIQELAKQAYRSSLKGNLRFCPNELGQPVQAPVCLWSWPQEEEWEADWRRWGSGRWAYRIPWVVPDNLQGEPHPMEIFIPSCFCSHFWWCIEGLTLLGKCPLKLRFMMFLGFFVEENLSSVSLLFLFSGCNWNNSRVWPAVCHLRKSKEQLNSTCLYIQVSTPLCFGCENTSEVGLASSCTCLWP